MEKKIIKLINEIGGLVTKRLEGEENIVLIISSDDRSIDIDIDKKGELTLRKEIGEGKDYQIIWKDRKYEFDEIKEILVHLKSDKF